MPHTVEITQAGHSPTQLTVRTANAHTIRAYAPDDATREAIILIHPDGTYTVYGGTAPYTIRVQLHSCGIINWRAFAPNHAFCEQQKAPTYNLRRLFTADVADALVIFHYGDAVKNFVDTEEQAAVAYNVLPVWFSLMSYPDKVELMRTMPQGIDLKRWSRQQWPLNSLRYAQMRGKKLVFLQSDTNYCSYPSMFAEAMCGTLYETGERIDDQYYHFTGPQQSLYCVGDWSIANALGPLVPPANILGNETVLRNDFEWARMTDTFLLSVYTAMREGTPMNNVRTNYLYYPWHLITHNLLNAPEPVTLTIVEIGRSKRVVTITWMDELNYTGNEYGKYQGRIIPLIKTHIAVSTIFGLRPDILYVNLGLDVVQPLFIGQDVTFDGTYDRPTITVTGQPAIPFIFLLPLLH